MSLRGVPGEGGRCTVVVIDDEPALLEMLCAVLEEDGFGTVAVPCPELAAAITVRPDLVLVDLMLPRMDGIELARRLRMSIFPNTPMVAISASTRLLQLAADSGLFRGVLAKPFDLSDLLQTVRDQCPR